MHTPDIGSTVDYLLCLDRDLSVCPECEKVCTEGDRKTRRVVVLAASKGKTPPPPPQRPLARFRQKRHDHATVAPSSISTNPSLHPNGSRGRRFPPAPTALDGETPPYTKDTPASAILHHPTSLHVTDTRCHGPEHTHRLKATGKKKEKKRRKKKKRFLTLHATPRHATPPHSTQTGRSSQQLQSEPEPPPEQNNRRRRPPRFPNGAEYPPQGMIAPSPSLPS